MEARNDQEKKTLPIVLGVNAFMMVVGVIALIANSVCLALISKHRYDGVHMRASVVFAPSPPLASNFCRPEGRSVKAACPPSAGSSGQ
jgi:hypothetical protein